VLYLDHNDPGEPFGVSMTTAFRSTMNAGSTEQIAIYAEHLDLIRSSGPRYDEVLKNYLREKYQDIPIGVIVGPGTAALTFMLPMRAEMWPQVPAIFVANPEAAVEAQIRPGVTGLVRRQPLRDSVRTTRALVPNLIMNAAEAMDAVTDRPRMLRIKTEREKDNGVLITLQDSGPGIDPESTDRIFNAFFTTKPQGMGMGLSICCSIVEAHGGRLWASAGMDRERFFTSLCHPTIRSDARDRIG
jgi:hypothetical protein